MATTERCWNVRGIRGDQSCPRLGANIHCRNCPDFSDAGRTLLDRPVPADYLREWNDVLSAKKEPAESTYTSVLIFRLGGEWLSIPVGVVREITPALVVHSLPHRTSGQLLGVSNVRGELHLCVSLDALLGIEPEADTRPAGRDAIPRFVVMERERERWVFPAAEIHGTHRFGESERRQAPATVAKAGTSFTKTMFAWEGKTVGLLDDELLFYALRRCLQ